MAQLPEQLTLPGWPAPPAPPAPGGHFRPRARYKLFLALFPAPAQARGIAQRADHWRQQHRLTGAVLDTARLHATLQVIGDYARSPTPAIIDAVKVALACVDEPALDTRWDRLHTFPGNGALVLRCDTDSQRAFAHLRDVVQRALARQGVDAKPSTTPHMTLLYDKRHVAEHPIEPICWTATEVALILSHLGRHHHQWLARRALNSPVV